MKTRIEIYEIDRPQNIVASGSWNRQLSTAEIRKETEYMMRYIDSKKFASRVITDRDREYGTA